MQNDQTTPSREDLVLRSVAVAAMSLEVGDDVRAWKSVVTTDSFAGLSGGSPIVLNLVGPVAPDRLADWVGEVLVVIQQMVASHLRVIGVSGDQDLVQAVDARRWPGVVQAMPVLVVRESGEQRLRSTDAGLVAVPVDEPGDPAAAGVLEDGQGGGMFEDGEPSVAIGIPTFEEEPGEPLVVLRRKVRSGEKVTNNGGDLHVYGTVGSGAEIHAAGSILVFGEAAGRLFAGRFNDRTAVVSCNALRTELVSVAGLFATGDRVRDSLLGKPVTVSYQDGKLLMTGTPVMEPPEAAAA